MNNTIIRKEIKIIRDNLSSETILSLSKKITDHVLSLDLSSFVNVFIYQSFKSEVNTELLINNLLRQNKVLSFPVTKGDIMLAGIPSSLERVKSSFGVLEPKEYTVMDKVDLCIVPLLACDKNKNRLGYGKGFYDKFFATHTCYKIGICFDFQVVDSIIPNSWDVPLDLIITDKQIIR